MYLRNKFLKLLKFLGKALLGLLLLLLLFILLLHTTLVQRKITRYISGYLSTELASKVDIASIRFSVFGNLTLEGLKAYDPTNQKILSIDSIHVTSHLSDLFSGDYIFGQLYISGVEAHLTENTTGLKIQYILNAFTSGPKLDTVSTPFAIQFKKVQLKNILFDYTSFLDTTSIDVHLGDFAGEDIIYSTDPDQVKAKLVALNDVSVNILTKDSQLSTPIQKVDSFYFTPDFGLGIGLDIEKLEIKQSAFAYNINEVETTPKFDPSHIYLKDIEVQMEHILVGEDSLQAKIPTLTAQLPGFNLRKVGADIDMGRNSLTVPALYFESGSSEISGAFNFFNDNGTALKNGPDFDGTVSAKLEPNDFSYFLTDEVMAQISQFKNMEIAFSGDYKNGVGALESLSVKTPNSEVFATGILKDIWNSESISWNDMDVKATIGPDFKKALNPYLNGMQLPPELNLDLISSGTPKKIFVNGKVNSTWGNLAAKGDVSPMKESVSMDIAIDGDHVQLNKFIGATWLGPMDFNLNVDGSLGGMQDAKIDGVIHSIQLMERNVRDITLDSEVKGTNVVADFEIGDARYLSNGHVELNYAEPMHINSQLQLDSFQLGHLLSLDSTLALTGAFDADVIIDDTLIQGSVHGREVVIQQQSNVYRMDTLALDAMLSPNTSIVDYLASDGKAHIESNFDLQEIPDTLKEWSQGIFAENKIYNLPAGNKTLIFNFQLDNPNLFHLADLDIESFNAIKLAGNWDQQKRILDIEATAGDFSGFGITMDTIHAALNAHGDSISSFANVSALNYGTFQLGDLDYTIVTKGDTAFTKIYLSKDSVHLLRLGANILPAKEGIYIYPDTLFAFDQNYHFDPHNPIFISDGKIAFDSFQISRDEMMIKLDGDINSFHVDFSHLDLASLNQVISEDAMITSGLLSGMLSYSAEKTLELNAHVDSLSLNHSIPLSIVMTAQRDRDQIPFQFLLSNASNKVDLKGQYALNTDEVKGDVVIDVNDLGLFGFLVSDYLAKMNGKLEGKAAFSGPLKEPTVNGYMRFQEANFTTARYPFTFKISDDTIKLNRTGIFFDDFTFYDEKLHPLTIDGHLTTEDYASIGYDLTIHTDHYLLLNNPGSIKDQLSGILEIGADVTMKGNEKDTKVDAKIHVLDTTQIVYVIDHDEIALLETEGIVDFVDPGQFQDTTHLDPSGFFYDSLIASLPDFNFSSTITIDSNAMLKVITNEQSGDYFEASGGAKLDLGYDRTGKLDITGSYTIKKGLYRMSFYDLVKKNFTLVKGSSIKWSGNPENGDLDIKAVHIVSSNSVGLMGDDISENEKSIYKKSLDYVVGITIKGTVEVPIVAFTLDLPEADRASYPVLASKLDRLKSPEFQSDLNKQVFGLLVLGGFLPETSGADINENLIATTAISNSINSLLSGQLNRFAGQYIKGVNIDIGIQSYSDFSTPGGKTQTAMDFHVSKSFLNERLSFEVGGDFDINSDQSGSNTGDNYRGDIAIIYDLTGNGDKQLKLFNNESYDIIYQEIRNTGISLIFIREFNKNDKMKEKE